MQKKYSSLKELREDIDKLDANIVDLIATRSSLVRQAAQFKSSTDEIKANERLEHVVQGVRQLAIKYNISPNMIEDLYRRMIDEMVEIEIAEFQNTNSF